jgi:hypothetical protein
LKIEERVYSREEFENYLVDHSEEIFEEDQRRRWLKIYCLLVSSDNWQNTLFKSDEITKMGDVFKATIENDIFNGEEGKYYILEHYPGLLLMYTTATDQEYKEDLGRRIARNKGITRMWMRPQLFKTMWKGILEETDGFVYRFTSRRGLFDNTPCKLRPSYKRRFSYTGDDGTQTIAEVEELYGAMPESIYMEIDENLKVHLTNDGLYSAQEISANALNLFYKYLDKIKDDVLEMRRVSTSLRFDVISEANLKTVSIEPGVITIKEREVDSFMAEKLMESLEDFSFIDIHVETGSLSLTATVIDELKDSIFNINASESQILIVPKTRTTFESFIDFYRGVVESIDESAEFSLLSYST